MKKIERKIREHGFDDFKWIKPSQIVVANWVRMKCRFGCSEYGRNAACPPNTPSVKECHQFFREYRQGFIIHVEKKVDKPEDRHAWTRQINARLWELEREVFLSGYEKAFLLYMDSCSLCETCSGTRDSCLQPLRARPTPEALAVDVFATARRAGYPIQVLSAYQQPMNRYAFLLIS